ncbi:Kef-type potassium/proton antiporter (CPA2 family) [Methylosinus sp. sav-2]|jgi:CPA2 family monovalent cation:H+ antiporter-2|uniref:cation:proton antiporter domain-containing protein n=1 Tax=Methylosinus sp. sav-2 TaxID=2485168 RepID=UPI00047BC88A|nr:cation:proton antiporter [Methylosinus sp. sav-2]TDX65271.1 Kef-type potassium/proton antiporter (CPA2 family) [Methylosinus sp. sav-2]
MQHGVDLVTTLAAALGLALFMGLIAAKLRLSPLVGYLFAGILIGPATPGFVADVALADQLAEIGIILLMFGVGLHLSIDDLLSVRRIAAPGAVVQMAIATALGVGVATYWGWHFGAALIFGLSLSCASTVVLLRALEERGEMDTINGRIAIGWLVVEDLATVLLLVLLPPAAGLLGGGDPDSMAGETNLWPIVGLTLAKVAAFVILMLVVGRWLFPRLLFWVAGVGSRELFTLCVVATAIGVAYGSAKLFDVSFALGAFFAGMMMRESEFSHRAADESLPLRDAFSVLFFVSVGMAFDPRAFVEEPWRVLAVVGIVMVGKTLAAVGLTLALRYPLDTALTVGASLAQIGEFSFILAGLGVSLGLISPDGRNLILAGALVSIALNSLVFVAIEPIRVRLGQKARSLDPLAELPASVDDSRLAGQIVLVGYGRVGSRIGEKLLEWGAPFVVIEQNRELVETLRAKDIAAVCGDASEPATLAQAHIARASELIVSTTPDSCDLQKTIAAARRVNPSVGVALRARDEAEAKLLELENIGRVFSPETELSLGMLGYLFERLGRDGSRLDG